MREGRKKGKNRQRRKSSGIELNSSESVNQNLKRKKSNPDLMLKEMRSSHFLGVMKANLRCR